MLEMVIPKIIDAILTSNRYKNKKGLPYNGNPFIKAFLLSLSYDC